MSTLPVLFRLVLAHHAKHWTRALLSIFGIAVSVSLVVWIIRGYDAVSEEQALSTAQSAGRFDVVVVPPTSAVMPGAKPRGGRRPPPSMDARAKYVDGQIIDQLRKDPDVAEVITLVRSRVRQVDPPPAAMMGPFGGGMLLGTDDTKPPLALSAGRWLEAASGDDEAVVSTAFAARNKLQLEQSLTVGGNGGEQRLKIVGLLQVVPGSGMRGPMGPPHLGDIYVMTSVAEKINGYGGKANAVLLVLKDQDMSGSFSQAWATRTATSNPPVTFRSLRQPEEDPMSGRMLGMIQVQAHNATFLAFLAAAFIIFTALNAGVRERLRQLAFMRAVAMSRSQLTTMIFLEAILLAVLGWGLGLGLARGLLRVGNALGTYLQFFQAGAFNDHPIGWNGVLISLGSALCGCLAAAVLPAWRASKMKPIDLLGGQSESTPTRFPWAMVIIGLVLVILNPIVVLLANVDPFKSLLASTYSMGFAPPLLSSAAVILGLVLITPGFVRLIEFLAAPLLARLLRLNPRFLRQQLSGNLWRAVGTTISLSAGLTIFVTALVWGYSMLVPFTPDKSLPRMLVSILPAGIPENQVAEVCGLDGVLSKECLKMAVEQPRLSEEMLRSKSFSTVDATQEHLLVMGVDPEQAFSGQSPVLGFTFVQGSRETAAKKLEEGRYCLVPDHFQTQTGLGLGDTFSVDVPESPGQKVEYEIAGVVYIPGWNWFTKFADIRRRSGRALAMVFADYRQVKADFHLDRVSFFWMNVDQRVSLEQMEQQLIPVGDRHSGVKVDVAGVGETKVNKQYIKITERADLTQRLNRRADDVIWSLTRFPLLALVIASLAVFNAIFASVRSRYWQFGILRGVGLSRWQLFRLIIGESFMLFVAAGTLSLFSGTLLAWCGIRICTIFFYFAGRTPPLVLPWGGLSLGFGIAFGLCFLAGLIPAWQLARKEPLGFIQAGRVSM
jgi:putative ABC transport system permease protein